jgi:hypothetical protein
MPSTGVYGHTGAPVVVSSLVVASVVLGSLVVSVVGSPVGSPVGLPVVGTGVVVGSLVGSPVGSPVGLPVLSVALVGPPVLLLPGPVLGESVSPPLSPQAARHARPRVQANKEKSRMG